MRDEKLFLAFQCLLNIVAIKAYMDIGCNYVNWGGLGFPMDFCWRFNDGNVSFASMGFQCNDASNGVDVTYFTSSDCTDVVSTQDFTSDLDGFDCNKAYESVSCPEVSILAYEGDICDGDDYSEYRFIVDQCLRAEKETPGLYGLVSCTTDSVTVSLYQSFDAMDHCEDTNLINRTVVRKGIGMDGIGTGCIDVDGCYEDGSFIPRTDIGCNYINVGDGIPLPTDHCMQIDFEDHIIYTKFMCNHAWNGVMLQAHTKSDCSDKPFYSEDFTSNVLGFECNAQYQYKVCNEVSVKAYPTEKCDGDQFSWLRFITDACVPVFSNESLTLFGELTCTEHAVTYSVYDIPVEDYGHCEESYLMNQTNLTEGVLDGEFAKCIDVEGCGDYTHDIEDFGCNYINLDGFGMPTDTCMKAKGEQSSESWMVYCNDTWNGMLFGIWEYNKDCHGTPVDTRDITHSFPFVCNEDYNDIQCDVTMMTAYLDKTCSGSEYFQLSFITDVCLYNDVDDYIQVMCDGEDGMLSIYETVDGSCNDETLVNRKTLSSFEFMNTVFECVDIENCDDSAGQATTKPNAKPTAQSTKPTAVVTSIASMVSTVDSAHIKVKDKKSKQQHKGLSKIVMVAIVSAGGSCVLLVAIFCLIQYCKQKREVKNMDVTHTGQLVTNPYGQIDSIN